jgi:TetR/AcrR family transcriptional regulator, tetracycline repressor protein
VSVKKNFSRAPAAGRRKAGRPAITSRAEVLEVALRIVDEHGLERLTMRRLGAELGVDPMTVYHHIPDKAALFDGLIERVLSEIRIPETTGDWKRDLRATVAEARATLLAHPHTVVLLGTRPPISEPAFALVESITAILLHGGFSGEQAADGFDCAGRLLIGHTLAETGRPPGGEISGGENEHRDAQAALDDGRYPALAAVQRAGVEHDPQRLFELALDGLLLALQAQRDDDAAHDHARSSARNANPDDG